MKFLFGDSAFSFQALRTAAEGAGEHCREGREGGAPRIHRRVFDRLDERPGRA